MPLMANIQVFPGGCLVQTSRGDEEDTVETTVIFPTIEEAVQYVAEFLIKHEAEEDASSYVI